MRTLPLVLAVASLLTATLPAQVAQPVNVKSMLEGLEAIKQTQAKSQQNGLNQAITDFSNAAGNEAASLNFYMEAVRVTQFVGRDHEQAAFRDWKKREGDKLNPTAIRLALQYTVMTLQRAAGGTDRQMFPHIYAYAQDLEAAQPTLGEQPLLDQDVGSNIFARWYNVGPEISRAEHWPMTPGDLEGIYAKFILPYLRASKDPRILDYWDRKLAGETKRASAAPAQFATDRFNENRRPELLWQRAEDEVAIGMRDQGLGDMYGIVKQFPAHPKAGAWIGELQGLLTGGTGGAPAAPAAGQ